MLLSLLATITVNSAHKVWLFRVSFLLLFFTRVPAHVLLNNNYTYWAHLMNPALLSVVTWEDPELPVSTSDSTITGGEWLSPSVLPMHTLESPWTINGSHPPFCITNWMNAQICAYTSTWWHMNNMIKPPKRSQIVTIKC